MKNLIKLSILILVVGICVGVNGDTVPGAKDTFGNVYFSSLTGVSSNTFLNGSNHMFFTALNGWKFDGNWHTHTITNLVPTNAAWIGVYVKGISSRVGEGVIVGATNANPQIASRVHVAGGQVDSYGQIFLLGARTSIYYYGWVSASNPYSRVTLSGWGY